jgi:hypothetical protein
MKYFTDVIYDFSDSARVLAFAKPLQPSLMFADKGEAYQREASFKCSTLG